MMASQSPTNSSPTFKRILFFALGIGIAGGGFGGALGYMLGGQAISSKDDVGAIVKESSSVSQTGDASAHRNETALTREENDRRDRHGRGSANRADKTEDDNSHSATRTKALSSRLTVRELPPIVTNLVEPANNWIRIQSAIVFNPEELPHPEKTIAELTGDITGYLRTVSLTSLEGVDGLRRLQEELSERAAIRSNGKIHEFIVETMVVQ